MPRPQEHALELELLGLDPAMVASLPEDMRVQIEERARMLAQANSVAKSPGSAGKPAASPARPEMRSFALTLSPRADSKGASIPAGNEFDSALEALVEAERVRTAPRAIGILPGTSTAATAGDSTAGDTEDRSYTVLSFDLERQRENERERDRARQRTITASIAKTLSTRTAPDMPRVASPERSYTKFSPPGRRDPRLAAAANAALAAAASAGGAPEDLDLSYAEEALGLGRPQGGAGAEGGDWLFTDDFYTRQDKWRKRLQESWDRWAPPPAGPSFRCAPVVARSTLPPTPSPSHLSALGELAWRLLLLLRWRSNGDHFLGTSTWQAADGQEGPRAGRLHFPPCHRPQEQEPRGEVRVPVSGRQVGEATRHHVPWP